MSEFIQGRIRCEVRRLSYLEFELAHYMNAYSLMEGFKIMCTTYVCELM